MAEHSSIVTHSQSRWKRPLRCQPKSLDRWFRQQIPYDRKSSHDTDSQERPSGGLPLIFVEPTGNQQADASAKGDPSSCDQHDFGDRNRSMC